MTDDRPLRIAIVAPPFYELPPATYGGTELICHVLAEALIDRGHHVMLVGAGRARTRARFVATFADPQPEGTAEATRVELLHAARAASTIAEAELDLVHDHTRLGPLTAGGRAAPTVLTVHAALSGPDAALAEVEAVQRWVYPVAISATQRGAAPQVRWVATVHNGIDLERYPPSAAKDDFVLFLGRISRHKGVGVAIDAACETGRRLVIAGGPTVPEEHDHLEADIRPRLDHRITWVGEVNFAQKVYLLGRASCLLFPAMWDEPFGLTIIEAMACGTPVVALRRGSAPELIADGQTGVVCDRVEQIPEAVAHAADLDPRACRAHVEAYFSASRMAGEYEAVYRACLHHDSQHEGPQ
jgi:glycosyltransferase involved in cell wall biosynthesis